MAAPKAFISYAREDAEFVHTLRDALAGNAIVCVGDWALTAGDKYEDRLRAFILGAEAFIFVITPDSLTSDACRTELMIAIELKKAILPISRRDHGDDRGLDSALRAPQWTMMRVSDEFDKGITSLIDAIRTDFALMEAHTRLLIGAETWGNAAEKKSGLLRGSALMEAQEWLATTSAHPEKLPQPTPREVAFIEASRKARAARARTAGVVGAAVLAALAVLAVVAWIQRNHAVVNATEADAQRQAADGQRRVAETNAERAREVGKRRLVIATLLLNPEGTTFSTLLRNPDTAGLTFGLGTWAQRMGTLHTILAAFDAANPARFAIIFGSGDADLAKQLLAYTARPDGGVDKAGKTMDPKFDLISEPWLSRFTAAGADSEFQSIQLTVFTNEYLRVMERLQQEVPEVQTERGVAFMLDIVRQHGLSSALRFAKEARTPGTSGSERDFLMHVGQRSVARVSAMSQAISRSVERRRTMFLESPYLTDTAIGF